MEKGTTFTSKNETWKIDHIMTDRGFILAKGWTHTAAVTRPRGKKLYWANLVIEDGKILHSAIIG